MTDRIYIPPDYNSDDNDDIPDEIADEDEGIYESYLDNKFNKEEESKKEMSTPPFPGATPTSTPRWGQPQQTGTTTFPWQQPNNTGGSMWEVE